MLWAPRSQLIGKPQSLARLGPLRSSGLTLLDDFEGVRPGVFSGYSQRPVSWTPYSGSPVLSGTTQGFTSVLKSGDTFYAFYGAGGNTISCCRSSDGKIWGAPETVLTVTQEWVGTTISVPMVWVEGSTWYMLYRGGSPTVI